MRLTIRLLALSASLFDAFSPPEISIMQIQGRGHVSPFAGDSMVTTGVVTVVTPNGFFVQDPVGDGDPATSDGLFAFTGTAPTVDVGDRARLAGVINEFLPGGDANNLTVTELTRPVVTILSHGHALPKPATLGCNGYAPPTEIIDDDGFRIFDPADDGIDFYESVESMWVRIPDAMAISATNPFGEFWVIANSGECATGMNARGGITISSGDMNPERIQVDDALLPSPLSVGIGDLLGDITGVISYRFGSFEVLPERMSPPVRNMIAREVTPLSSDETHLTVASFNVHNLGRDQTERIAELAQVMVNNLRAPDIVALQEIQDDSGVISDGTVDACLTYAALVDAISAADGPRYDFRDVPPVDEQDGGEPGANIRISFLFRTDRVAFVDRGTATAGDATTVIESPVGPMLSLSPGRIDPLNEAWRDARKPLAGEFVFAGRTIFVIACHFTSRTGSTPLFGATQPPQAGRESQRIAQARVVRAFIDGILATDARASIVVLGDFNDFQFSRAMVTLAGNLVNLTGSLPSSERYTYNFEGNSQALDHILVSNALWNRSQYDIVHTSAEYADGVSDHDPAVARLSFASVQSAPNISLKPIASPNPFNVTTSISYITRRDTHVEITIYDVTGRHVRTLTRRKEVPGEHAALWDGLNDRGKDVRAGVYFVRVVTSDLDATIRVVRVR